MVASNPPPSPSDFDDLPYPRVRWYPQLFFMKMTAKDVKEITYMPLVTFFSVLDRPGKTVRGLQQPPLVRRGIKKETKNRKVHFESQVREQYRNV